MSEPETMDEFERALVDALRRVDAPEGFAERVVERSAEGVAAPVSGARGGGHRVVVMPRRWVWAGGAVAAMLAVGAFVGETVHVRHQREQAALATQQFEAAVRVTDHALDQTRAKLERAGLKLDE